MQLEQRYFIGVQDVGAENEINNKALLDALSNTATVHATSVGQGLDDIYEKHITWVALNWKVEVFRRIKACNWLTVRTWAQDYTRIRAERDYEVYDDDGNLLAKAISIWTALDPESGAILKLTPELMDDYQGEPERKNFPDFRFPRNPKSGLEEIARTRLHIMRCMIDCNHHVHNTSYLDLAREVLPEETEQRHFDHIEISYRQEIKPDEQVEVIAYRDGTEWYVHIKSAEDDVFHAEIHLF